MKRISLVYAALVLILGASACRAEDSSQADTLVYKDGSETVAVKPVESTGLLSSSAEDFISKVPLVVEARMRGGSQNVAEVQPDPKAEGVLPGDGKDIYGAIDFDVVAVVKGDPSLKSLRLVYQSGKRDPDEKDKRIAYTYEGLKRFQMRNGKLLQERTLKTHFLFLRPSTLPVAGYELAHPEGVAEADGSGFLRFSSVDGASPIAEPYHPEVRKSIRTTDIEAVVRK